MIQIFKINDPARIILLLFLLLVLRIPFMVMTNGYLSDEILWMTIGENLNQGYSLYKGLDTSIGPLAAFVYQITNFFFGPSLVAYQILSLIVVAIQAIMLSLLFNRTDVTTERTFIPSLIYILLASMAPDMFTLSPVLMATTFIMLAFAQLIWNLKHGNTDQSVLVMGIHIGVAALFYLPSLFFMVMVFGTLLFYSGTILRRFLLLLFGIVLTFSIVLTYYYVMDNMSSFLYNTFSYELELDGISQLNVSEYLWIAAFPLFIVLIGVLNVIPGIGFVNYQLKCHRGIFFWAVSAALAWVFSGKVSTQHFILFVAPASFFITRYFLMLRRKWLRGMVFYLLVFSCLSSGYLSHHTLLEPYLSPQMYGLLTPPTEPAEASVVVFGDQPEYYIGKKNQHVTRYLDWGISASQLDRPEYVPQQAMLFDQLTTYRPEVIIDHHEVVSSFLPYVPFLSKYKEVSTHEGDGKRYHLTKN